MCGSLGGRVSAEGLWILTLPAPNVFLGQDSVGFSSCPCANTYALGNRRQRGREGKTWTYTSKSAQVSRGKKLKRMISLHSFPPLSTRCGEGACYGVGGRQSCCYADPSISVQYNSSCLWGSSAISTQSLGFSRGHNLPVSHSACSPSALLKESRHFPRSQRSSLSWLDIYTCIFYQEIGEWHLVLVNLKTVESFFP